MTFVTIYEEVSIIKAAKNLGQNPSTISHRLNRLRKITGDDLFIRSGRSLKPTIRARDIVKDAKIAIDALNNILANEPDASMNFEGAVVIGLTDLETSDFLISLHKEILQEAPKLRIEFTWNHFSDASHALRSGKFDFILSPNNMMNHSDIMTRVLMREEVLCYYDAEFRSAPETIDKYLAAKHISVMFSAFDINHTDIALARRGANRETVVTLPSYTEVPHFLKGTDLIVTLPASLKRQVLKGFGHCKPPFDIDDYNFSLFWHRTTNKSPKHIWLREKLFSLIR